MPSRAGGWVLRYFAAVRLAPDTSRVALGGPWAQHLREAHRERGSLGAGRGPASLRVRNSAADSNHTMGTERVLVLCLPKAWGPGAVRRVAARPLPLVPRVCLGIELRSRCHFKSSLPTAPSALRSECLVQHGTVSLVVRPVDQPVVLAAQLRLHCAHSLQLSDRF